VIITVPEEGGPEPFGASLQVALNTYDRGGFQRAMALEFNRRNWLEPWKIGVWAALRAGL